MSYGRGRGRGRGRGGGGFRAFSFHAKKEPFVLFPDIDLPDVKSIPAEKSLTSWDMQLQKFWRSSPYHLEESGTKKVQHMDIERYTDWGQQSTKLRRGSLNQFLVLDCHNFPKELIGGAKRVQKPSGEVRWNPDAGWEKKLDLFKEHEDKLKGQEEDGKKEGAEDEESGNEVDEAEEEPSDGDYDQGFDFDDDEDDFNLDFGDDEGPIY